MREGKDVLYGGAGGCSRGYRYIPEKYVKLFLERFIKHEALRKSISPIFYKEVV